MESKEREFARGPWSSGGTPSGHRRRDSGTEDSLGEDFFNEIIPPSAPAGYNDSKSPRAVPAWPGPLHVAQLPDLHREETDPESAGKTSTASSGRTPRRRSVEDRGLPDRGPTGTVEIEEAWSRFELRTLEGRVDASPPSAGIRPRPIEVNAPPVHMFDDFENMSESGIWPPVDPAGCLEGHDLKQEL